jgi:prepilin-type N-terminal cleavage/methylation domain-containing protein
MRQELKRKPLENRDGFTLVEVMIALAMLTIALLGLVSVTVAVIQGTDFSKRMTTATTLAKDKMEEIGRLSYNNVVSATDYRKLDSSPGTTGDYFTRVVTVTTSTGMKTVKVAVNFNWGGKSHTVELNTIISK